MCLKVRSKFQKHFKSAIIEYKNPNPVEIYDSGKYTRKARIFEIPIKKKKSSLVYVTE